MDYAQYEYDHRDDLVPEEMMVPKPDGTYLHIPMWNGKGVFRVISMDHLKDNPMFAYLLE